MLEHVAALSDEIGERPAGSPTYDDAVAYAREQLEASGYDVELQAFTASRAEAMRLPTVSVLGPEPRLLPALTFAGSAAGDVSAPLVDAGAGLAEDFGPEAAGAVVLIQRGDVFFVDMARNALEAGAAALLVTNDEEGLFGGEIDPPAELPAAAITQAEGETLRELLADGPVEVSVTVSDAITSSNVIARPSGQPCRTVTGGHLDSVPWAPGAGDNASGSAVVLELARAAAAARLSGHCFALFGAEEFGLVGSRAFVSSLTAQESDELEAYLNYDVTADVGQPTAVASAEFTGLVERVAERVAVDVEVRVPRTEPPRLASDHLSFIDEGLPAIMLTNPEYDRIHVPEDTFANLEPGTIEPIAALGFALLREFDGAASGALPTPVP